MVTKKKVKLPQPYSAVRDFLEKNGCNVVLIGGARITGTDQKYNFHVEFDFTGSKKSHE